MKDTYIKHLRYAYAAYQKGQWIQAHEACQRAHALEPYHADVLRLQGAIFMACQRMEDAKVVFYLGLDHYPNDVDFHANLGLVFFHEKNFYKAKEHYQAALNLQPNHAVVHANLAMCYRAEERFDLSLYHDEIALQYDSNNSTIYYNLGVAYDQQGLWNQARKAFEQALEKQSDHQDAKWNLALLALAQGDFDVGWLLHETRWQHFEQLLHLPYPRERLWQGDMNLQHKTLLIHAEQGMGDTIQFCRYIPLLIQQGAKVFFEVQHPLVRLMGSLHPDVVVLNSNEIIPNYDFHCPLLSLPFHFKTQLDTIPAQIPYLTINSTINSTIDLNSNHFSSSIKQRLRIGLCPQGGSHLYNPNYAKINQQRNLSWQELADALQDLNLDFYNLQKGDPAESEIKGQENTYFPNGNFYNFADELHDFADTAALIMQLDLVISVDTAVAHLAAALGKPTWLLNRFNTCWRWMLDRNDSPWYPTMKLYRQCSPNEGWNDVLTQIHQELKLKIHAFAFKKAAESYQKQQFDNALTWLDTITPKNHETHALAGVIHRYKGQEEKALFYLNQAIRQHPTTATLNQRSLIYRYLGQINWAYRDANLAVQLDPNDQQAQWNLGLLDLLLGQYTQAWSRWEWRKQGPYPPLTCNRPEWLGQTPLHHQRILIINEQGFGDTIQFVRYAIELKKQNNIVVFLTRPALKRLFSAQPYFDEIWLENEPIPWVDVYIPLLSLSVAFKTTLDTIPSSKQPYLTLKPEWIATWKAVLSPTPPTLSPPPTPLRRLRVGLCPAGGTHPQDPAYTTINAQRNIPWQTLAHALHDLKVDFYNLQKGEPAESDVQQRQHEYFPNGNFYSFVDKIDDFADTAALITNLDLVISVDTVIVHLAAALGKPTWLLNRFDTCWRWLLHRQDSPWYPTLKIYRQTTPDEGWEKVLVQVRNDLRHNVLLHEKQGDHDRIESPSSASFIRH